jgi:hypothetical protein
VPALPGRLGVSQARLDQAFVVVRQSLSKDGGSVTVVKFEAALAKALGMPLARVKRACPAGELIIAKRVAGEVGGKGTAAAGIAVPATAVAAAKGGKVVAGEQAADTFYMVIGGESSGTQQSVSVAQ